MKELFKMNSEAHYMKPGAVAFIPGWVLLFITILTLTILKPDIFFISVQSSHQQIISPFLLAFILGSLMPAFDDLFTYIFGRPFAHHSLFHSFFGLVITYLVFYIVSNPTVAIYAIFGNIYHIFFNFLLDYTTLFFPLTYREFGLTDIIKLSTYQIKVVFYPLILVLFAYAVLVAFH